MLRRENFLYVLSRSKTNADKSRLKTYSYQIGSSLGEGVCTATIKDGDKTQTVVVMKQRKSFAKQEGEDDFQTVAERIIDGNQSVIFLEHALHAHLLRKTDGKHVAKLLFADEDQFTFLVRGDRIVPVKVSKYYAPANPQKRDRQSRTKASNDFKSAEKTVQDALNEYYAKGDARARDEDWKNKRNILVDGNNKCLFHDFDCSVASKK